MFNAGGDYFASYVNGRVGSQNGAETLDKASALMESARASGDPSQAFEGLRYLEQVSEEAGLL